MASKNHIVPKLEADGKSYDSHPWFCIQPESGSSSSKDCRNWLNLKDLINILEILVVPIGKLKLSQIELCTCPINLKNKFVLLSLQDLLRSACHCY